MENIHTQNQEEEKSTKPSQTKDKVNKKNMDKELTKNIHELVEKQINKFLANKEKTKEISREYIVEYLAGEGRATLEDITKNLWNITGPYKNTLIYSCLHDLVRAGRVVNKHRGGSSYYELR